MPSELTMPRKHMTTSDCSCTVNKIAIETYVEGCCFEKCKHCIAAFTGLVQFVKHMPT